MSATRSQRHGQTEVGIDTHKGREFAALGATVHGRDMTAYTMLDGSLIVLTTWAGKTTLACRHEVVRRHRDGSLVLLCRLRASARRSSATRPTRVTPTDGGFPSPARSDR